MAKMREQNGYKANTKAEQDAVAQREFLDFLSAEVGQESRKLVFANLVKVPLQVSRGLQWDDVPRTKTSGMTGTNATPEIVARRANHIYRTAFEGHYDPIFYNFQAFVMYLAISLDLLDGKSIVYV